VVLEDLQTGDATAGKAYFNGAGGCARCHKPDGDLARVATPQGESVYRALLSDGQRRGEAFVPIHWTDQQSSGGRTGLLPRARVDPHSGQPGFKSTPARVEKVTTAWRGFLIAAEAPTKTDFAYVTRAKVAGGWLVEFAGEGDPARVADALLPRGPRIEASDAARGTVRAAVLRDGKLAAAMFVTRSGMLPRRDWLIAQLQEAAASPLELLAGRASTPAEDRGPIVCVCFDVGLKTIVQAIATQALTNVEAVGKALNAGTNCGSCRPAIQKLLVTGKENAHG